MKRALWVLLVVAALAAAVGGWSWQRYQAFLTTPVLTSDRVVVIEKGASYLSIIRALSAPVEPGAGETVSWPWRLLGRLHPAAPRLKAGEFLIPGGATPGDVLDLLASGAVIQHAFTIVEGWRFRDLLTALSENPVLEQTLTELPALEITRRVDPELAHPEGWFAPETYYFPRGEKDIDLLRRAHATQQKTLAEAWEGRDEAVPLGSAYDMLVLASIVEKETGRAEERGMIAGVFARRLELGMRLQTDPTVIYGLGDEFDGDLRRRDLRTDTPYNTYTRFGLPPTPIALPGADALRAAANPEPGDSLYFVSRGDGSHQFSATLKEHNAAVAKYQLGKSTP
ncbi:MAG: endolytic transglycosylase MltG [Pseudomonadota bacterium]